MMAVRRKIEELIKAKAVHRKGFRLDQVTPEFAIKGLRLEVEELAADPLSLDELGDVWAILIHIAMMAGHSESDIMLSILNKLDERFTIPNQ